MGGFNKILNYVRYEMIERKSIPKMQNKCQWSEVGKKNKKQRQRKKNPKLKGRKNKKTSASMARAK